MKLTAKTDLDAPISFVYECLSDHASWEREAVERGIDVEHPSDMPVSGLGSGWLLRLPYRGKLVKILLRLVQMVRDESLEFDFQSQSIEGDLGVSLMALSPRRTRMQLSIDVRPRTLAARLFLNTLRLARGRVQAKVEMRVKQMGMQIQNRYARNRG
jgi:hypothetical protein